MRRSSFRDFPHPRSGCGFTWEQTAPLCGGLEAVIRTSGGAASFRNLLFRSKQGPLHRRAGPVMIGAVERKARSATCCVVIKKVELPTGSHGIGM